MSRNYPAVTVGSMFPPNDDSYEAKAYRAGQSYYAENPAAEGQWGYDKAGKVMYLCEVPGWHLFSDYDYWFRVGYTDTLQGLRAMGRPVSIPAPPASVSPTVMGGIFSDLGAGKRKKAAIVGVGLTGLAALYFGFFGKKGRRR